MKYMRYLIVYLFTNVPYHMGRVRTVQNREWANCELRSDTLGVEGDRPKDHPHQRISLVAYAFFRNRPFWSVLFQDPIRRLPSTSKMSVLYKKSCYRLLLEIFWYFVTWCLKCPQKKFQRLRRFTPHPNHRKCWKIDHFQNFLDQ